MRWAQTGEKQEMPDNFSLGASRKRQIGRHVWMEG